MYTWLILLLTLCVVAASWLWLFYKRKFRYWADRNVPHTRPSFPMGDFGEANRTKPIGEVLKEIYDAHPGKPYVGFWSLFKPTLMVRDPALFKRITIQDFQYFHDHGSYYNEESDPLAAHLFSLKGSQWRNLRVKLTPTFSSGKMKMMFPTLMSCSEKLVSVLQGPASRGEDMDMKDVISRFAMEVVSICAFGIDSNTLNDPDSMFIKMARKSFGPTFSNIWRNTLAFMAPELAQLLKIRTISPDVSEFFLGIFKETFHYRQNNNIKRNDFMQLLIQLTTKGYLDDADAMKNDIGDDLQKNTPFTMDQAAAQAFVFFVAGSETTATSIQFTLYELARHPGIQQQLRREIQAVVTKHGEVTYDGIHQMPLLDRVVSETLRMHPPAPSSERTCTKDYTIEEYNLKIDAGTSIISSFLGMHYDPEYFPEPHKFDPDRFLEDRFNKSTAAYQPFGDGPRVCIGQRFALMEIFAGLIALLRNFQFELCPDTPVPVKLDPKSFITLPKGGLPLKITKIQY